MIDAMQKEQAMMKETVREAELKVQSLVNRLQDQEKEAHIRERKEKSKL